MLLQKFLTSNQYSFQHFCAYFTQKFQALIDRASFWGVLGQKSPQQMIIGEDGGDGWYDGFGLENMKSFTNNTIIN